MDPNDEDDVSNDDTSNEMLNSQLRPRKRKLNDTERLMRWYVLTTVRAAFMND